MKKHLFIFSLLTSFLISCGGGLNDENSLEITTSPTTGAPLGDISTSSGLDANDSSTSNTTPTPNTSNGGSQTLPQIDYIKVFAPSTYFNIYLWTSAGQEVVGGWPGTQMEKYDDDWKTYDIKGHSSINLIFNNSNSQTADLSVNGYGFYWYYNDNIQSKMPNNFDPSGILSSIPSSPTPNPTTPNTPNPTTPTLDLPEIGHIKVFAPKTFTHIYAWLDGGNVKPCGNWPGTTLNTYDDVWNTYDFEDYSSMNLIFSENGNNQTANLYAPEPGYYWYHSGGLKNYHPDDVPPEGEDNPSYPDMPSVTADSYLDFSFWDEYPSSYWTTINKYEGDRLDFRNESIYFTITTRFYDGDTLNNVHCWDDNKANNPDSDPAWRGDFKGLIEKMDYIKALGFTAIWITPVVENASGYDYHGYHAMNFNKVDPRYESEDVAFQDVINEAHARDMKIILDVVFNHTGNFGESYLFPMFEKEGDLGSFTSMKLVENNPLPSNYESLSADEQYNERIAAMKNERNNGADPNNIYHHHKDLGWESFSEQIAQIAGDCVDLNTENPLVAEYLVRCYGEFIKMGVDAFRIDTMKHISRLTLNNYFFPALYEFASRCGNDNFFMFGEVCTRVREVWNHGIPALSAPFYTWKEEKNYSWGDMDTNMASIEAAYNDNKSVSDERTSQNAKLSGINYHTPNYDASNGVGVIDFPMHWNFQKASDAFRVAKENDQYYNDASYNVVYVDSHDYGPDCIEKNRYNMGTKKWAENMNLMFTFRGIPCIYYGSEIEFKNDVPIDVGPNAPLEQTGRAYFGDHLEGNVTATGFGNYTASGTVNNTLSSTLSQHLIKLNKIRQAIPALSMGQYTSDETYVSGDMSFIRRYTSHTEGIDSLALVSISGGATFTGIPNGKYIDAVTGDVQNVSNGTLTVPSIGESNLRVYVCCASGFTGITGRIGNSTAYLK